MFGTTTVKSEAETSGEFLRSHVSKIFRAAAICGGLLFASCSSPETQASNNDVKQSTTSTTKPPINTGPILLTGIEGLENCHVDTSSHTQRASELVANLTEDGSDIPDDLQNAVADRLQNYQGAIEWHSIACDGDGDVSTESQDFALDHDNKTVFWASLSTDCLEQSARDELMALVDNIRELDEGLVISDQSCLSAGGIQQPQLVTD